MVAQLGGHKVRSEPRPLALASSCPVQQAPRAAYHGEQTQARDGVLWQMKQGDSSISLPASFLSFHIEVSIALGTEHTL